MCVIQMVCKQKFVFYGLIFMIMEWNDLPSYYYVGIKLGCPPDNRFNY